MSANDNAFEIHVHGDVKLRPGTRLEAIEEALKPLWQYAGARSLAGGAASLYEEEHAHLANVLDGRRRRRLPPAAR